LAGSSGRPVGAMFACTSCGQTAAASCAPFWRSSTDVVKVDFAALRKAIQEAEATELGTSPPTVPLCVQNDQCLHSAELVTSDAISTASGSTAAADEDQSSGPSRQLPSVEAVEEPRGLEAEDDIHRQRREVAVAAALEDAEREWERLRFQMAAGDPAQHAEEQFAPASEDGTVSFSGVESCPAGATAATDGMLSAFEVPPSPRDQKPVDLTPEETARVQSFLASRGFASVTSGRRRLLKTSYPLHAAVAANDSDLVRLLLRAGADPSRKSSSGVTPRQLAQKSCRRGSHAEVLLALDAAQ